MRSTNSSPTWRGERAHELGLGDRALLDEQPTERLAAPRLFGQRRVELGLGQEAFVDEQRAERRSVRTLSASPPVDTSDVSALLRGRLYRISLSARSEARTPRTTNSWWQKWF